MPITGGGRDQFITDGTLGITSIRFQTSGGYVYDETIDDTGHVVTTLVSSPGALSNFLFAGFLPLPQG